MAEAGQERAVAVLLGALANETRVRIIMTLAEGTRTVGELTRELDLPQSSTSQHLTILARAGVLQVEKQGTFRHYRLLDPVFAELIGRLSACAQPTEKEGPETP